MVDRWQDKNARGAVSLALEGDTLLVVMEGHLDFPQSHLRFASMLDRAPSLRLVCDTSTITTYAPGMRRDWIKVAVEHRKKFTSFTVVGGNALIRIAAATLTLGGIKVSFKDHLSEVDLPPGLVPRPPA